MKVAVKRVDFLRLQKTLNITKLSRIPEDSAVTLTVSSEKLTVVGQGFKDEIDCDSSKWGSVTIPLSIWKGFFQVVETIAAINITIEAENGIIKFHNYQLKSPKVIVSRLDKVSPTIPLNAGHTQIIKFPFEQGIGYERLKVSAIWKTVKAHMNTLNIQLTRAVLPLADYGIREADLAELVAQKLGIIDKDTFFKILFTKE